MTKRTKASIAFRSASDWGVEHTDEETVCWLSFIERRLTELYPGAAVEVEEVDGESSASVKGLDVGAAEVVEIVGVDLWEEFCASDYEIDPGQLVSVRVDEENNAEEWWDAVRAADRGGAGLEAAIDSGRVTRAQLAVLRGLPGWSDGPEFARTALVVED